MAEEEKQMKEKPSFKNFIKNLYGNKFKGLTEEDVEKVVSGLGQLQEDLLAEINNLAETDMSAAEKLAKQIGKKTGFSFTPANNERGGAIFVVGAPSGKSVGGAIAARKFGNQGKIDENTTVTGDSFISKNDVMKTIKGLSALTKKDNLTESLVSIVNNSSKELSDIVAVEQKKFEVNLLKALTTTAVVAVLLSTLVSSLVAGYLNGNQLDKSLPNDTVEKEIVYLLKEEKVTVEQIVNNLISDSDALIEDYGDTAKLIKGYRQEEWEERRLSGLGASTESERIENENSFEERIKLKNDFAQRKSDIEQARANGTMTEREYVLETLKLQRDISVASEKINLDSVEAIKGASSATETHMKYYETNGLDTTQHQGQIEEFNSDIASSQDEAAKFGDKADMYDGLIKHIEANPEMSSEEVAKLLEETFKQGSFEAEQTNETNADTIAETEISQ